MRDPSRIYLFCKQLAEVWCQFPDWRFGQLMSNILGQYAADTGRDIFFPEEQEMMAYFRRYAGLSGADPEDHIPDPAHRAPNGLTIDDVWPVHLEAHPNGGVGISWSGADGFGEYVLFWGEDGKLHADTECMDSEENRLFTRSLLNLLSERIVIDG